MKISIEEIKKAFFIIINTIEENIGKEVEFASDYYWSVGFPERNDFQKADHSLMVGSLSDDIRSLRKSINDENIFTTVDFERFANIILEISNIEMFENANRNVDENTNK